jgi:16S rRNA (guanine527-N7)-methyltransferase
MQILKKYFPELSEHQLKQFEQLLPLYKEWNEKINVISRKDIDNLYEHHVLHSLAMTKILKFRSGATILDLGTGGGFPGIPLAIYYPKVKFTLIDGTRKKITVVQEIVTALNLKNVEAKHQRVEELKGIRFDFVVTRAVAGLSKLLPWSRRLLKTKHLHKFPNGLIALKGGRLDQEVKDLPKGEYTEQYAISDFFDEPFFEEKFVVYVQG